MISIDFETRGAVDLITDPKNDNLAGLHNYASDPATDIICMWYSVDGGEPKGWHPGEPIPRDMLAHDRYYAWNAEFERVIWDYIMVGEYGFPEIPLENWRCSMYMSTCSNMPAALGNAARCLNVEQQKSTRGRELIKLLCVPMADGTFNKDPALLAEMDEYCAQDVRTEMACVAQLREPTDQEWADYHANCRVNDRGVKIDRVICDAAQVYAQDEIDELVERIEEVTEGAVVKARGEKLKAWVIERLTPEQEKVLVKYRNGERKLSLDKYNRARLLDFDDLDPDVAEVVECSDFAQKSSVGKFKAMSRIADPEDDRVRGALVCNGASESGRYSSRGCQVHNFPRVSMKDPVQVREDFVDQIMPEDMVDYYEKPIMTILSHMLRPALIPEAGSVFLVSDWSAIEGRVAPWLCDDDMGAAKLKLYADDEPVYEIAAAATFNVAIEDVTKDQRQIGKVQELSFQYQGGAAAFLAMARNYGLKSTKAEADRYKDAWRRANPWAVNIWNDIERAARLAVRKPGVIFTAGRLKYFAVDNILVGGVTLFCQLPCGRVLTYPDVRFEMKMAPWGEEVLQMTCLRSAYLPKAGETEWPRAGLYGGKLFNNAVQGTAASLMRFAVQQAQDYGLSVVFHVHDELVVEAADAMKEDNGDLLYEVMNNPPEWATGLPLKADVDIMERFGK